MSQEKCSGFLMWIKQNQMLWYKNTGFKQLHVHWSQEQHLFHLHSSKTSYSISQTLISFFAGVSPMSCDLNTCNLDHSLASDIPSIVLSIRPSHVLNYKVTLSLEKNQVWSSVIRIFEISEVLHHWSVWCSG